MTIETRRQVLAKNDEHSQTDSPQRLMTSPGKVACHTEKMNAFLAGEPVFPVTVEMDITTECGRGCSDCPSTRSPEARNFPLERIDRFFGRLEGQTRGLLLSGGEPTSSPDFPAFLRLARSRGFEQIAIVSNGAHLDDEATVEALLEDATVLRISLYGWDQEVARRQGSVLKQVEALRRRIDESGSSLHIGISALTESERVGDLESVADAVRDSGGHWVYFHPICTGWGTGALSQSPQTGVTAEMERLQAGAAAGDFEVHFCPDRYRETELTFSEYYSAYFLMVVGADGINYLGTETKYQEQYAISDVAADPDFPWSHARLERIRNINHSNYPPLGGRHRGLLYNDHIERLKSGTAAGSHSGPQSAPGRFLYPHIL